MNRGPQALLLDRAGVAKPRMVCSAAGRRDKGNDQRQQELVALRHEMRAVGPRKTRRIIGARCTRSKVDIATKRVLARQIHVEQDRAAAWGERRWRQASGQ